MALTKREFQLLEFFQKAYGAALGRCSNAAAPGYVIPVETMDEMNLTYHDLHLDIRALKKQINRAA